LEKEEKHKLLNALIYPSLLLTIMGLSYYPRKLSGLRGVLFAPFLHGSPEHLFNNAISFMILCSSLFFFYKKVALRVLVWVCLMGGLWTWILARDSYHIGASGIIYGLFSFLLISGFVRKNLQLVMLSFFVVFVYGSMVWGIFPIKVEVSYESHLWGFVSGLILAFYYKKQGPQKVEHVWEDEEDDDEEDPYWKIDVQLPQQSQQINYIYKSKEEDIKE